MKRRRLIIWLSALAFATLFVWLCGERIYTACILGRIEFSAAIHVRHLGAVDEVEICSLGGRPALDDPDPFEGDGPHGVVARKTVTGRDAAEIADLWRSLPTGRDYQYMCFNPAYGLRFRNGGKLLLKTSVCWECQGLTFPALSRTVEWGFDAKSEPAQKLLKVLQTHVPLPIRPGEE
jgi:hypothetical protein